MTGGHAVTRIAKMSIIMELLQESFIAGETHGLQSDNVTRLQGNNVNMLLCHLVTLQPCQPHGEPI